MGTNSDFIFRKAKGYQCIKKHLKKAKGTNVFQKVQYFSNVSNLRFVFWPVNVFVKCARIFEASMHVSSINKCVIV